MSGETLSSTDKLFRSLLVAALLGGGYGTLGHFFNQDSDIKQVVEIAVVTALQVDRAARQQGRESKAEFLHRMDTQQFRCLLSDDFSETYCLFGSLLEIAVRQVE